MFTISEISSRKFLHRIYNFAIIVLNTSLMDEVAGIDDILFVASTLQGKHPSCLVEQS